MLSPALKVSPVGLTLKAWALFKTAGVGAVTLISQSNVASVTRTGVGTYAIAYTAALPSADCIYRADVCQWGAVAKFDTMLQAAPATTGLSLQPLNAGVVSDTTGYVYVEVWG